MSGYDREPLNQSKQFFQSEEIDPLRLQRGRCQCPGACDHREPPILERETARLLEGLGAQVAGFSWPRISPSGFLAVCTLMYMLPLVTALD